MSVCLSRSLSLRGRTVCVFVLSWFFPTYIHFAILWISTESVSSIVSVCFVCPKKILFPGISSKSGIFLFMTFVLRSLFCNGIRYRNVHSQTHVNHRIYACRKKVKLNILCVCAVVAFSVYNLFIYLAQPNFIKSRFFTQTPLLIRLEMVSLFLRHIYISNLWNSRAAPVSIKAMLFSHTDVSFDYCRWCWYRYCCCRGLKFNNDSCCALL